jgi:arylsulfatase
VLFIVWDDIGFGAMEPFGGLIETPVLNRLAKNGLRYTQFHTTALCSPTRAAMLTGRNHTTVGMYCIAEATTAVPGSPYEASQAFITCVFSSSVSGMPPPFLEKFL